MKTEEIEERGIFYCARCLAHFPEECCCDWDDEDDDYIEVDYWDEDDDDL